jgi:hypothetical protein
MKILDKIIGRKQNQADPRQHADYIAIVKAIKADATISATNKATALTLLEENTKKFEANLKLHLEAKEAFDGQDEAKKSEYLAALLKDPYVEKQIKSEKDQARMFKDSAVGDFIQMNDEPHAALRNHEVSILIDFQRDILELRRKLGESKIGENTII